METLDAIGVLCVLISGLIAYYMIPEVRDINNIVRVIALVIWMKNTH